MMPNGRIKNTYAERVTKARRSFHSSANTPSLLGNQKLIYLFRLVDQFKSASDLIQAATPGREFSWNFRPLLYCRKFIEFRITDIFMDADEAIAWIALTIAFISVCRSPNWDARIDNGWQRSSEGCSSSLLSPLWNELSNDMDHAAKQLNIDHLLRLSEGSIYSHVQSPENSVGRRSSGVVSPL